MIAFGFALLFFLHQAFSSALGVKEGFAFDAAIRSFTGALPALAIAALYFFSLSLLYWLYFLMVRKMDGAKLRGPEMLAAGLLLIGLWLIPPSRSTDVFAYLAHGHNAQGDISQHYAKPIYADDTPYLKEIEHRSGLVAHGASPYGPWWSYLEILIGKLAPEDVYAGTLLLKLAGIFAFLLSALVANRIRPGAGGLVLFNPYLLTELIAEGHNDAWLVLFVLIMAWAIKTMRIGPAVMAGTAGVLTKYVPALLAGPALGYAWRNKLVGAKLLIAVSLSAAILALSFYPLWLGGATFRGVQDNADAIPAFVRALKGFFRENPAARTATLSALWVGFLGFWAWVSARAANFEEFVEASAKIFLAYFLFFPPFVWAWYLALPVALLALLPRLPLPWLLSLCLIGSLQSPLWAWKRAEIFSAEAGALLHHAVLPGFGIFWFVAFLFCSHQGTFTRSSAK